jgi:hypothetical protein
MVGGLAYTKTVAYGSVCAVKLGLVTPKRKRKPGRFSVFGRSTAVKVDDGQIDFFGAMA